MIGRRKHIVRNSFSSVYALCIGALISSCVPQNENSERIAKETNDKHFDTKSSEKEADFVVETMSGNFANVKFAEMAIDRSGKDDIREIAEAIHTNDQKLIRELKGFANMRGITIPLEENPNARRKLDDLAGVDTKSFDEKWCHEMANRREKSIENLEVMWEHTSDEELKEWINSALPVLRNDLVKLQSCREKLAM
jgi:predicted outer membrane protein